MTSRGQLYRPLCLFLCAACSSPADHAATFASETSKALLLGEHDGFYDRICEEDQEVLGRELFRKAVAAMPTAPSTELILPEPAITESSLSTTYSFQVEDPPPMPWVFANTLKVRVAESGSCLDTNWMEHHRAGLLLAEARPLGAQFPFKPAITKVKEAMALSSTSSPLEQLALGGDVHAQAVTLLAELTFLADNHLVAGWFGDHVAGDTKNLVDESYVIWTTSVDSLSWRGTSSPVVWRISMDCNTRLDRVEFDPGEVRIHPIDKGQDFKIDGQYRELDQLYFLLRKKTEGTASLRLLLPDTTKQTVHFNLQGADKAIQYLDRCGFGE